MATGYSHQLENIHTSHRVFTPAMGIHTSYGTFYTGHREFTPAKEHPHRPWRIHTSYGAFHTGHGEFTPAIEESHSHGTFTQTIEHSPTTGHGAFTPAIHTRILAGQEVVTLPWSLCKGSASALLIREFYSVGPLIEWTCLWKTQA